MCEVIVQSQIHDIVIGLIRNTKENTSIVEIRRYSSRNDSTNIDFALSGAGRNYDIHSTTDKHKTSPPSTTFICSTNVATYLILTFPPPTFLFENDIFEFISSWIQII